MSLAPASLWHVDQFYLLTSPDLGCFVGNLNFCSTQIKRVPVLCSFFVVVIKDKSEIRSCLKMINSWQGRTASSLESAHRSAPAEPAAESCHPQREEPWQGTVLRRSGSSLESWEPCSAKEERPEAPPAQQEASLFSLWAGWVCICRCECVSAAPFTHS